MLFSPQTPLCGEYSRLNRCLVSLDRYTTIYNCHLRTASHQKPQSTAGSVHFSACPYRRYVLIQSIVTVTFSCAAPENRAARSPPLEAVRLLLIRPVT